jgi:hypothetical protein
MNYKLQAIHHLQLREEALEVEIGYEEFPILYIAFASIYKLGKERDLFMPLIVKKYDDTSPLKIKWDNLSDSSPWISLGDKLVCMDSLEQVKREVEEYRRGIEDWHKRGMIKIGHTHGDVILLGIDGNIKDEVYLFGESMGFSEFRLIAKNIFILFSRLELVPDVQYLQEYEIDEKKMFKQWGDHFYVVRND